MPNDHKNHDTLPPAQLELCEAPALGCAVQGPSGSLPRITVRFVSFRVTLLDDDNVCEKDVLDGLRHAGLIPDDARRYITLQTEQEKVAHRVEEKTEIFIDYPTGREPKIETNPGTGRERITF